ALTAPGARGPGSASGLGPCWTSPPRCILCPPGSRRAPGNHGRVGSRRAGTGRWGGAGATAIPSPTNRCTLLGAPAGAVLLLLLLLVGIQVRELQVLLPLPLVLAEHTRLSS